jgi:hypothetical protein
VISVLSPKQRQSFPHVRQLFAQLFQGAAAAPARRPGCDFGDLEFQLSNALAAKDAFRFDALVPSFEQPEM